MNIRHLEMPLTEDDLRSLRVGDIVTLSGILWTCGSRFHVRTIEEGIAPPIDTRKHNVMLYSEPIVSRRDDDWKIRAASITASSRFERWEPAAIESLGIRAVAGKGKVGRKTLEAMKRFGCIHLIRCGLFPGSFVSMMKRIQEVHWLDLGLPEALWVIEVAQLGPFIVEADLSGESLYETLGKKLDEKIPRIYERHLTG